MRRRTTWIDRMVAWWPTLEADSYGEMGARLMFAAEAKNGLSPVPNGELPSLTNDDTLILVEYWLLQAKKNGTAWPEWYPITLRALGYRKKGDKFKVDKKHAQAWLPAEDLPLVWEEGVLPFAARLDREQTATPLKPTRFKPSKSTGARFMRAAKAAWERLRRERGKPVPVPPRPGHGLPSLGAVQRLVIGGVLFLIGKDGHTDFDAAAKWGGIALIGSALLERGKLDGS